MRRGFTMIELIFVIVILGILAAVAIPKLSATRDDAKMAKLASNIQTAKSEVSAYIVASGSSDLNTSADRWTDASNVIAEMVASGDAVVTDSASPATSPTAPADFPVGFYVNFNDTDNEETCVTMDFNGTDLRVVDNNDSTSLICTGVFSRVPEANISVRGSRVKF